MREHVCIQCGIEGYSPEGEVPHGWLDKRFAVHVPLLDPVQKRAVVCGPECWADLLNEYESRGAEVEP